MGSLYNNNYQHFQHYPAESYGYDHHSYGYAPQQPMYPMYCHDPYSFQALQMVPENSYGAPCQCDDCIGRAYEREHFQSSVLPPPVQQTPYTPEHSEPVSQEPSVENESPADELTSIATEETKQLDPIERSVKYIFIGQLPFEVSDDTVNWLVRTIGKASKVHSVEAVWKQSRQTGELQHKGCVHVLVPRHEVDSIVRNLHHRLLMSQETLLVGTPAAVNHWAGRVFDADIRTASKPVVCEPSNRQLRK